MVTKQTKSNAQSESNSDTHSDEIFAAVDGAGVTVLGRANDRETAPAAESRVAVVISTDIIDRFEGQTDTWSVWGPTTNREFVARQLADPEVLALVTDFLSNRSLVRTVTDMIHVPIVKPSETLFSKPGIYASFLDTANGNRVVAQVLMELILPGLIELGFVSANGRFAQQVAFDFKRVTVRDLSAEVAMVQAFNALANVKISGIDKDHRQSKAVFAEALAEVYRPVGLALGQAAELSTVLDDIVKGVRAHLTPPGSVASEQISVPSTWYNNASIAEFAKCLPFIRAALALPTDKVVRLRNEGSNLDSWLRLVTEMLRESDRYQWISRAEALRHYSVRKIRDPRGEPIGIVTHRSIKTDAVAQSVIAVPDAVIRDGNVYDITATKDRIAEVVQAGYGKADFSTDSASNIIFNTASDLVALGYKGVEAGFMIDAYGRGATLADIAALTADRVYVPFLDNAVMLSERTHEAAKRKKDVRDAEDQDWDPMWWFGVTTKERQLTVRSGTHFGDAVLTSDPIEALLAAEEFGARDPMPARKQVLGPNAFNARVMNFEENTVLQGIDSRYGFRIQVDGKQVGGAFRAMDFSSLRAARLTRLVRPHYNAEVIRTLADSYATALMLIEAAAGAGESGWAAQSVPTDVTFQQLRERIAIKFLQLAQGLSPAFRQEVQQAVIERVLLATDVSSDQAVGMRASLVQDYFTAFCDVIALEFFLHIQGIRATGWDGLVRSETLERVCMTMGSDRKINAYLG